VEITPGALLLSVRLISPMRQRARECGGGASNA